MLAQIGVCVRDASLDAIVQGIDRVAEDATVETRSMRVRIQNLPCVAHRALQFAPNMPTWIGMPTTPADTVSVTLAMAGRDLT